MRLGLIFSNDWELFGDGSGDFFEIQHRPLRDILTAAENYGVKITIMAETAQQWAHKRISREQAWAGEIASAWEEILQEVIKRKSDVQLHIHENWLKAEYGDLGWKLNTDRWDVSCVDPYTGENVFLKGKQYLEGLLKPVDENYRCVAVRLGAFIIEPSRMIISKMKEAGIVCDSSIVKGLYRTDCYDHRKAYSSLPYYTAPDNLKLKGRKGEGVLEFPIYSHQSSRIDTLFKPSDMKSYYKKVFGVSTADEDIEWLAKNNRVFAERYPMKNRLMSGYDTVNKGLRRILEPARKLTSRDTFQLDYDHLPPQVFVKMLEDALSQKQPASFRDKDIIVPIIAIGHTKIMHNCDNFCRIIDRLTGVLKDRVVFWTFREAVEYYSTLISKQV